MLAAIILNSIHDVASYLAFICRVRIRVRIRVRFRSCPVYPLAPRRRTCCARDRSRNCCVGSDGYYFNIRNKSSGQCRNGWMDTLADN